MLDQPMSTVGDVAMGLEVTFLNSAVDSVGKHPLQAFVLAPSPALQSQIRFSFAITELSAKHCNNVQRFLALSVIIGVSGTILSQWCGAAFSVKVTTTCKDRHAASHARLTAPHSLSL